MGCAVLHMSGNVIETPLHESLISEKSGNGQATTACTGGGCGLAIAAPVRDASSSACSHNVRAALANDEVDNIVLVYPFTIQDETSLCIKAPSHGQPEKIKLRHPTFVFVRRSYPSVSFSRYLPTPTFVLYFLASASSRQTPLQPLSDSVIDRRIVQKNGFLPSFGKSQGATQKANRRRRYQVESRVSENCGHPRGRTARSSEDQVEFGEGVT